MAPSSWLPTVTPRDLRRTAASIAIASGAGVLAVRRMLGHKDASMTLNVYADLFDTDAQELADLLDRLASAWTRL
ncbi:tyrosine-type recombinase/integrase [Jiangella endophytica]|uniref:tyrosine-type recombinase/integrase n=1 Tax=Jiangella endophytica TaxID=1623398 RepID=UPI000E355A21|nr:tyrosine-type recombinase/integrase [Jiangella endophytica]